MLNFRFLFGLVCLSIGMLNAQSGQQYASLGDLRLESGEALRDCRIGFRTFGTPARDSSNVVLLPTWFGGNSEDIGRYAMGAGKYVDTTRYCVIAVDATGNGIFTSPSNSDLQPGSGLELHFNAGFSRLKYEK
jgi:homoserine O-acetyltransferase